MNILNGIKKDAGKQVNKYKIKFLKDYYIILGILSSNKSSIFDEKIDGVMVREYFNEYAYVVFKTTSLSNISKIGYYKFDYNLIASVFFIDDDKEFKNLSDTDARLLDNYIFIDVDCSKIYKLNNRYDLLEDEYDDREMGIENLTRDSVFRKRTFSTKDFYYKIGGFFKKDKTLNRYFNVDILDLLREFCITYNNKGKINTKNSIPSIIKILKDFESRGLFVIFRFKNVTWFELLFAFSRYNIHISGGHPSKRHLLSNIEFVLSLFLVDHHKSSIENLTKQIGFNILSPPDFNSNKLNFILKTLGTKNRKFIGANDPRYRGYLTLYSLLNYGYFLRNKIIDILNNNLFYKLNDYKVPENYMEENDSDIRYQFMQIFSLAENNLPTDLNHRVIFADIKKHIDLIWKLQYIYLTKEPIGINIIKSINVDLNEHLIYFISEYQKILYKLSQLTYYLSYLDSKYSIEMDKLHVNKKKIEPAESLARDKKLEKEIKTFVKTNANLDRSIKNYKNKKLKNQNQKTNPLFRKRRDYHTSVSFSSAASFPLGDGICQRLGEIEGKKSLAREIGGVTNNREINDINKNILLHSENKNKNDTFIIEDNFNYLDLLFKLDIENLGKKGIKEGDFYDFMVNFNRNPLLSYISHIYKNTSSDTLNKQIEIEKNIYIFRKQQILNILKKEITNKNYGMSLILNAILKLERDFIDLKNNKKQISNKKHMVCIKYVENSIIISIVLSYVIPYLLNSDKFTFASLLLKIGRDIYYENFNKHWAYYNKINKINKSNARSDISEIEIKFLDRDFKISNRSFTKKVDFIDFIIYNNQDIFPILDEKDFISLALDLLEFISEKSNFFKLGNVWTSDGKLSRKIFADVDFNEMLLNLFNNELDKFPMIYKPKDWKIVTSDVYSKNNPTISKYGGFLLNEENLFYRSSKLNIGKINFNTNVVINCINKLASIRLSINTNVLNYILNLIYKDNFSKIKDLIYLKPHPSTNQLYKLKQAKEINEILEIERHNNKYYIDISTLNTALLLSIWLQLSKVNSYYLPIFIDWRGRFYTDTVFSYQGGELARSLILFREGKILNDTGLINLKIYTANCFGLNRYSHAYRIKWTEDNLDSILNLEPGFIFSAKEPFLFLACAFELKSYFKDPKNFISTLPIYLDATCNGLQHLASMIQDVNLSKLVNLYSSNEFNKPEDLYSSMINYVNKEIDLVIKEYPKLANISKISINRDFIKHPIMTISYGVTIKGMADQIISSHFKLVNQNKSKLYLIHSNFSNLPLMLTYKEIYTVAKIIYSVLFKSFPYLETLVKYFKNMNKILTKLGLGVIWLTPAGMIITQKYVDTISIEIISSMFGNRNSVTLSKPILDKINLRKQNTGIVPNIVHSLDATNVAILIKNIKYKHKNLDVLTIHDCFATQANDVEVMKIQIKLAFLTIYGDKKFLNRYNRFILSYIQNNGFSIYKNKIVETNDVLPVVPKFETNENLINNVLNSQYFLD